MVPPKKQMSDTTERMDSNSSNICIVFLKEVAAYAKLISCRYNTPYSFSLWKSGITETIQMCLYFVLKHLVLNHIKHNSI